MLRRYLLAWLLFCAAWPVGARAAAYDDYAHGISANAQGSSELAISYFSAAIAAGDLAPALLPMAYRGRAVAHLRRNHCALALADLDAAMALRPNDWGLAWLHGAAAGCLDKLDLALADYSAVIANLPTPDAYARRGRLRWRLADYAGAAEDFARLAQLQPKNPYAVLWLELSRARGGALDAALAARDADRLDGEDWPRPLLALYGGGVKPQDVESAAAHGDDKAVRRQQCEADFYLGEWWLARADASTAKPLLQLAADQCPSDLVEYSLARIELGRLK